MVSAPMSPSVIVGNAAESVLQGDGISGTPLAWRGLRLDTLVLLRWIGIAGQSLALIFVAALLEFHGPFLQCAVLVLFSVAVNLGIVLSGRRGRFASTSEATIQLGFDVLELAAVLFLTGGAANPFALLLIAPVTLAASSLPWRNAALLAALAIVCAAVLAIWAWPLPWAMGRSFTPPLTYRLGAAAAIAAGVAFTAGYAWLAGRQAARMELALHTTQAVLAREQRLSALGGLAAAAAHELGTPLATIAVVAKELAREGPDDNVREDARLLLSQTERCREILRRLTEAPEAEDAVHAVMSLVQLLNEVIEPHLEAPVRVEAVVTGAPGASAPYVRRMPEVLRAMTSFVDNAVDFAASDVLITARFDQETVSIEVRDDGPGFAPDVLGKLGQPYVTSRPSGEGSKSQHSGMGLGFFIAKTLLERTGAHVEFKNGKGGGAVVAARWPRAKIEVAPLA
jgi:two-component system sensor histidine kinase RegB